MKGPGIFLAQFAGETAPFNTLAGLAAWAAGHGYRGVQVPSWDPRIFDLARAAESQDYADECAGRCAEVGVCITELSTHLQGQLMAIHPAYAPQFDAFAPASLRGKPDAVRQWASEQLALAARASGRLGLSAHATFSGALLWHTIYPWPQRPRALVDEGFAELARRWLPILDTFDAQGIDVCFELHPGEDLHDGLTFERFLTNVADHPRAKILYDPSHFLLQQLDYLAFIDHYHERIGAFHVKDAEFRPSGRAGVYGSYSDWLDRPGRFRSPGDGQIDFRAIFSKFAQYSYAGWAVLDWECCLKNSEQGAREGARFISEHMIERASSAFDDFAGARANSDLNRAILGLEPLTGDDELGGEV